MTGLAEFIIGAGWGVSTGFAAAGQIWAVAPALLTAALMGGLYLMRNPTLAY